MQVSIKRVDPSLPLPRYESEGATAFDFITRETTVIAPHSLALIPGNIIVCVPKGYALLVFPRSSLPRKKGLVCPHSLGLIDQDYCGPQDEIFIQVQNSSDTPVTVERGERIAQGLFVAITKAEWKEVKETGARSRTGFGSTGLRSPSTSSSKRRGRTPHVPHARSRASSAS